jgi:predicted 3-demethylubiquinone-9 3-methyltransferase (glyoxalase superfamily)
MSIVKQKITPCLWFDTQAEEAAKFYVSVFPNSKITRISHYTSEGTDVHGKKAGTVLTVEFELDGQPFVALNGGPQFKFDEAISFQIFCADQKEIDNYWSKLTAGGSEVACGWLKDKFGLSWQIVPAVLLNMITDPDTRKAERVTKAYMQMTKFDIAQLQQAYDGKAA